ncbi:hypothetical protein EJB05_20402, partial [Eragrostis curvula]
MERPKYGFMYDEHPSVHLQNPITVVMAKLISNIFLTVALLSLLHSTLQAQGRSVIYDAGEDAAMQWTPLLNTTAAQQQGIHPNAITLRYCDRCTCCSPVICQTFNCCMESICEPQPSTGLPNKSECNTKPASCSCSTDTCR